MATFDAIFTPAQRTPFKIAALAASTASVEQAFGPGELFAINADQDITIRFGVAGNVGTPDATFWRIPQNSIATFDVGNSWTSFKVFNLSSTTAVNVFILPLSKV